MLRARYVNVCKNHRTFKIFETKRNYWPNFHTFTFLQYCLFISNTISICIGHADIVEGLIKNNASVNVKNQNGSTPLQVAVEGGLTLFSLFHEQINLTILSKFQKTNLF